MKKKKKREKKLGYTPLRIRGGKKDGRGEDEEKKKTRQEKK